MPSPRRRLATTIAIAAASAIALAGCAASADVNPKGEDKASIAVIEEFFAHLEAGETTEAAEMTEIDFPKTSLDEDFYTASGVTPSDVKVIETSGDDSYAVTATVEFVLDDPDHPATAELKVTNTDGERTIGWDYSTYSLINVGSPGHIVINDELEFGMSNDAHMLTLLPGLYDFEYVDPTGTTHLDPDGTNEFSLALPVSGPVSDLPEEVYASGGSMTITSFVQLATLDAVDAEIDRLTEACVAESMAGPSCPAAVLENDAPLRGSTSVEWFGSADYGMKVTDGNVEYSKGFTVRTEDGVFPFDAVYVGDVTQDADGTVTYTRK